jgi:REP element-mobilizing transposase RayT
MSSNIQPLTSGCIYHIFNRAVGNEKLFIREADHFKWIELFKKYVLPLCELYAYCLLPNHYHLLLRLNFNTPAVDFSKAMSDSANSFSKWHNKEYKRKGSLFMRPFKRKLIEDDHQLSWTTWYIHRNPMHHGYTMDWSSWKFSSFQMFLNEKPTALNRNFILDFFGNKEELIKQHNLNADETMINLIAIE